MEDNTGVQPITPHEAAAMVGIGVHSVRRWCEWHKQHLSEMANPGSGATRRLTRRDIEVLKAVKTLREQGLQTATINARLGGMAFADVDIEAPPAITESPHAAQEGRSEALAPIAVVVEALRSATAPLEARQEAQEARLQALERQRLRIDVVWIFAIGLFLGLIVGLSVWWFQ